MNLKQHIEIAVDNEFETCYTRKLFKAYLFKSLILDLTNRDIGFMIGENRKKVGDYLFQMELFLSGVENTMFSVNFETKFNNVRNSCEGYANILKLQELHEAQERALSSLKRAKEYNILNYLN